MTSSGPIFLLEGTDFAYSKRKHMQKRGAYTRTSIVLTGDNVGTIEPGDTRNGFATGGLTDQTQFVTFVERSDDRTARNVSPVRC